MIQKLLGETAPYCDELVKHIFSDKRGENVVTVKLEMDSLTKVLDQADGRKCCFLIKGKVATIQETINYFQGFNGSKEKISESELLRRCNDLAGVKKMLWERYNSKEMLEKLRQEARSFDPSFAAYDGNLLVLARLVYIL